MHPVLRCVVVAGALAIAPVALAQTVTATFDDLSTPPVVSSSQSLFFSNGESLHYQGITWDARVKVVGNAYRIDTATPGPLYGLAHSGNFFITSERDDPDNDGLLFTTNMLLTGAWFGRNAYYGFGAGGADQVTLHALAGTQLLASVVFDLPDTDPGNPAPLQFVDTSAFAAFGGITGYRIDRRALGDKNGHWVADDFSFVAASPVPEPAPALMWLGALALLAHRLRRRHG